MLSGVSGAALSFPRLPVSNPYQDQRAGQPEPNSPYTESSPAPSATRQAASPPVQPASQTEKPADQAGAKKADGEALSDEEEQQVRDLKQTDAKVRAHEQAHAAAGGPHAGGPSYKFTTGPDGKRYATSGEVEIDSAPERGDPEATIRKMDVVISAALAPAEPSSQDLSVARNAQTQRSKAQSELLKQRAAERGDGAGEASEIDGKRAPKSQQGALAGRVAEAAAAYAKTADSDGAARAAELFAVAQQQSIVV